MWWKQGIVYKRKDWIKNRDLKHFSNKECTDRKCTCENPKLVNLWEHDSCVRGRIDTDVCLQCDEVNSFSIIR